MELEQEVEAFVAQYGEDRRHLIETSLKWLAKTEPHWKLEVPMDRGKFIASMIAKPAIQLDFEITPDGQVTFL